MVIKIPLYGAFLEYSYLYVDPKTSHAFLIDPGFSYLNILDVINQNRVTVDAILITHGHFDHIGAVNDLREILNVKVYSYSSEYLENPHLNLSYGHNIIIKDTYRLGDIIRLDSNKDFYLKVLYAPGHTKDSVIYYNEDDKVAFVGDVIFKDSYGRFDFPGGNRDELFDTIKNKVLKMDPEMILYNGHTIEVKVKDEIKNYL